MAFWILGNKITVYAVAFKGKPVGVVQSYVSWGESDVVIIKEIRNKRRKAGLTSATDKDILAQKPHPQPLSPML